MPNETSNTMPYNRDAEMALLGCLLIDNEIATDIVETLTEDDFYVEAHKYIIVGMKRVFNKRDPIDCVTLCDELEAEGNMSKAGGMAYITELTSVTPSSANYKSYLDIVKRDSMNRKLIRVSRKIIENCMADPDSQSSVAFAEKSVYDISRNEDKSHLEAIGDGNSVAEVLSKFEQLQADPNALNGIPTGFSRFDQMTHGLQPGALIVLAARPGMGKTSLAMNMVEYAAMHKNKVCAVFSLEMPRAEIVQRLTCSYANVSMSKAMSGKLEARDWKKLMLAGDKIKESNIYINDSSRITVGEIMSECRRLKSLKGLDVIMIDYIQLMSGGDSKLAGAENRQQEIASITRDLKILAKELSVPVLALSQLKRMQTKEPQLSDLRESGAIEQDADIVMFINREEATATSEEIKSGKVVKGAAELHIAKHRAGEQGRIQLKFIGELTKFVDVDAQNRDDEPPQYSAQPTYDDEDEEEYVYEDDAPPMDEPPFPTRNGNGDDEIPFE